MVSCWHATATGDKDVLDVVLMKRSFICIIKHNTCYYSCIAYKRREEQFVCYLLVCHECKSADENLSGNSKKRNVSVPVKTEQAVGRDAQLPVSVLMPQQGSVTPNIPEIKFGRASSFNCLFFVL